MSSCWNSWCGLILIWQSCLESCFFIEPSFHHGTNGKRQTRVAIFIFFQRTNLSATVIEQLKQNLLPYYITIITIITSLQQCILCKYFMAHAELYFNSPQPITWPSNTVQHRWKSIMPGCSILPANMLVNHGVCPISHDHLILFLAFCGFYIS